MYAEKLQLIAPFIVHTECAQSRHSKGQVSPCVHLSFQQLMFVVVVYELHYVASVFCIPCN